MDDIVIKAMGKWPNVPACYGWLGLDARGDWYLRDLTVQAQGRFPQIKGEKIVHSKWIAFMGRNYAADANGCWFFQNGPQRVFVELEVTPWVFRFGKTVTELISHTGVLTESVGVLQDECGYVYAKTPIGLGLLHSHEVALLAGQIDDRHLCIEETRSKDLERKFGYVKSPSVYGGVAILPPQEPSVR